MEISENQNGDLILDVNDEERAFFIKEFERLCKNPKECKTDDDRINWVVVYILKSQLAKSMGSDSKEDEEETKND